MREVKELAWSSNKVTELKVFRLEVKGSFYPGPGCLPCSHSLGDQQDVLKSVAKDLDGDPAPRERVGEKKENFSSLPTAGESGILNFLEL